MASPSDNLASIDLITIVVYLAVVLGYGLWAGRTERNATDYFLAGRLLPWYLIGASFFASNMSGASFVGLMGASYSHGIVVFNYEWTAALVLIVFALVMMPVFFRNKLFTVPEYLERRYDRRSRWAYALFTIATLMLIDMAGALYAGSVVLGTAFPDIDLWQAGAGLALFAGIYTIVGGLRAVVVTDAIQAVLMIVGAGIILYAGLDKVGGWDSLMARLADDKTTLMKPADDSFLPWPGILGVVLLGFYYWTLNQYFVQRALAAKSLDQGRKGALFGGLLKLPNLFLMVVPGMIAILLFPNLDSPDKVFPTLALELLPAGLRGLVLTALLAAIMSSLDSALNAAASLLTMDFVRPLRPRLSDRALLAIGRIFTGILMVIAALYAPLIERFGSLFEYFQATLAYIVPPVVAVYLVGLFWRRATPTAGFWSLVTGLAIGVALFLTKEVGGVWQHLGLPAVHFTYMALLIFAVTVALIAGISLAGAEAAPDDGARFHAADLRPETAQRWYRDYRLFAALLGLATVATIVFAW